MGLSQEGLGPADSDMGLSPVVPRLWFTPSYLQGAPCLGGWGLGALNGEEGIESLNTWRTRQRWERLS
jgi:hypothetical protein